METTANINRPLHNKPSISKYIKIVGRTLNNLVLKDKKIILVILCVIGTNFIAAYIAIKTTQKFAAISDNFRTDQFNSCLKTFLLFMFVALTFKYIPMALFNWHAQNLQRKSYVINSREVIEMNYVDFHSKTPGDLHYNIFIKSFATVMTIQVLLLDFFGIIATVLFSTMRVGKAINKNFAVFFVLSPVLYICSLYYYIKRKMIYHYDLMEKEQYTEGKLTDKLLNYEAIKSYGLEKSEIKDFYNIAGQQTNSSIKMGNFEAFSRFIMTFSTTVPFIFMMTMLLINKGEDSTTGMFFELTLLYIGQTGEMKRLGTNTDQLVEYLNQINFSEVVKSNEIKNYADDGNISDANIYMDIGEGLKDDIPANILPVVLNNSIKWSDVKIMYHEQIIAENITLEIKKGEKIAIVGKNGTGKSTFIKSLLGFTKYTGDILIDDVLTRSMKRRDLMNFISYIPQDDCTSDDTVINNIMLGLNEYDQVNLSKTQQIQKIKEIAKEYNVHETFKNLDNGYETHVGSRGNKLSGGQKQKISLIRAVLKDAPIFLFDEATAALDKKYEHDLIKIILKNLSEKTVIMIVHGKDFLHEFDKIIFLNNGRVEGFDTMQNLMQTNVNFKNLIK
ncbi:fes-4 [Ecytonucleospora hepatopenaei]|uniref:Fes-4 n=1 Tax=Ecytonucleospora hepatopenaei TaxID=646526 RepID=A0A1W0E9C0_9MICR|nr:fes-4 [Ecytonucleospora hepatopenaei]